MSKNLIKVNTEAEVIEAQKNLEEPFVILVKDGNKLIYQDDTHCDVVMLIDDWNNYHTEIPVIQRDISWIKGRRCLVKPTSDGVAICYLDENNSELFHDGTTPAKLDGTMGMWMTDLPEFNIQCTQGESDWVKIHISKDQEIGHKSRRVLLGVTKGHEKNNKFYSVKLESSIYSWIPLESLQRYTNNIGDGFSIIDYETHCKLAYMFMSKYKTKDYSQIFPADTYMGIPGTTSGLGNNDGTYNRMTSVFGAENIFSGYGEILGGINSCNKAGVGLIYYIYDGVQPGVIPNVSYRKTNPLYTISTSGDIEFVHGMATQNGFISRMQFGEYADLIPTELSGSAKYFYPDQASMGFENYFPESPDSWGKVIRILETYASEEKCGLFGLIGNDSINKSNYSRLQYRGNITVIDDPQEFIALPVGF